ncbi:4802_t:CDS:2 [Entrophospora sp. SA101]|nr:4802_t:CDS:2 [Entrophospora sp. SA101]
MLPLNSAKRTCLSESPYSSSFVTIPNINNIDIIQQQQLISKQFYQQHRHRLLSDLDIIPPNDPNDDDNLRHKQPFNSSISTSSPQQEQQIFTKSDIHRIEKNIDLILENVLTQQSKDPQPYSPSPSSDNSIILDFPILSSPKIEEKHIKSPLSTLLNRTFPNDVVELVDKLSKLPKNNSNLDINDPINNNFSRAALPNSNNNSLTSSSLKFTDIWLRKDKPIHSKLLIYSTLAFAASKLSNDPSIQKTENKPGETIQSLLLLASSERALSRFNSALMFSNMADNSLTPGEEEERHRIFYCVYIHDRWTSFVLGKPYKLKNMDINIPLPTLPNFDRPTKNFFVAFIKLSHIIGQIWKLCYSTKSEVNYENWHNHVMDPKSSLRQIRSSLAKWLKELPDELQYQYLPNEDPRSLFQMTTFSVFAGYINILFHACILLLHQPYLTRSSLTTIATKQQMHSHHEHHASKTSNKYDPSSLTQTNVDLIKTCLTAATTITDIAKKTRNYDKTAFHYFVLPFPFLLQSILTEVVVITSREKDDSSSGEAAKALIDTFEEFKLIAEICSLGCTDEMKKLIEEVERILVFTNVSNSRNGELPIPLPFLNQLLTFHSQHNDAKNSGLTITEASLNPNPNDNNNINLCVTNLGSDVEDPSSKFVALSSSLLSSAVNNSKDLFTMTSTPPLSLIASAEEDIFELMIAFMNPMKCSNYIERDLFKILKRHYETRNLFQNLDDNSIESKI